jgi:hypothetical protein
MISIKVTDVYGALPLLRLVGILTNVLVRRRG